MQNQYGPGDDAPPVAILGRLRKSLKHDSASRYLSVYLGLSLIIVFLFSASLAPQLSQKWSTLQAKKQLQQSQAAAKTSPCYPLGDVNNDYYVTSQDADLVLAIVAKTASLTGLPGDYLTRADVDGKAGVTSIDALLIKKLLASQDPNFAFPACPSLQIPL